jgi:hypothetical protein
MKASQLVQTIPDEVKAYANLFVKAQSYDDPMAPPPFVQDIVWLSGKKGSTVIDDNVIAHLQRWLDSREAAYEQSSAILRELQERFPVPTRQEILNGATLPEYVVADWYRVLGNHLAQKHDEAMQKAREWLQNH